MFRAKALRREVVVSNSRRRAFAQNVDFFFIVLGNERTPTFRVAANMSILPSKTLTRRLLRRSLRLLSQESKRVTGLYLKILFTSPLKVKGYAIIEQVS